MAQRPGFAPRSVMPDRDLMREILSNDNVHDNIHVREDIDPQRAVELMARTAYRRRRYAFDAQSRRNARAAKAEERRTTRSMSRQIQQDALRSTDPQPSTSASTSAY